MAEKDSPRRTDLTSEARTMALPPETLEGSYALHDTYKVSGAVARAGVMAELARAISKANEACRGTGWSCLVSLVGGPADFLAIHFRHTIEALDAARWEVAAAVNDSLVRDWSLLGVTEAGLYHITAELARDAAARGGSAGDEQYRTALEARLVDERASDHIRNRLYPEFPRALPYVSFYPMSKRRAAGQNWYALDIEERSRLMRAHGTTGRKYAGKVQQIITGSIGLAEWEWGVTLFARDLLDVKKLVTDMRFDEVSAQYAEFGEFYVGKVIAPVER